MNDLLTPNTHAAQEAALAELDGPMTSGIASAWKDEAKDIPPETAKALAQVAQQQMPENKVLVPAGATIASIVPRNIDEAWRLAQSFVLAGMAPESYKTNDPKETQAKIMLGILKGLEVGIPPVSAISTIMIVNNRPSIWGDGAIGLVQASGKMEWIKETFTGKEYGEDWAAVCEVKRVGNDPVTRTFNWQQALKAGLTNKGPWKQYPGRMLQMRARAFALRDVFADALNGLAIYEEVRDYPVKDITPVDTSSLDDEATS